MKKLHLIRHAKSSWADPSLTDKHRPLNKRGQKSCGVMAKPILAMGCHFDHVFCSSAVRTQLTIKLINKNLTGADIQWQLDDELYTFESDDLLRWCQGLDDVMSEVVIVGHNPALTELCNRLTGCYLDNIPTCGYVQLGCDIESWSELTDNSAELLALLKPKMFR